MPVFFKFFLKKGGKKGGKRRKKMKIMRKTLTLFLAGVFVVLSFAGCGNKARLNPQNPVTLSIWHVYGNQSESPFNDVIEEFNTTTGKEKGVYVSVASIIDSDSMDNALFDAVNGAPGAAELPDLFTAYPRVAEGVGLDRLTDWSEIYTKEELGIFVDDFLAEGNIEEKQLTLPVAKSTELLFLNKTLFDRFCLDTGYTEADFASFDALFEMSMAYYDWSDGKDLFQYDDFYNYFLITTASMGGELVQNGKINCNTKEFEAVFTPIAEAAVYGGVSLYKNYATDLWKTGDILSYISSSAGILYVRDDVTYPDNSVEKVELSVLPYPVFDTGSKTVMQRGVTLFAKKTEDLQKKAAIKLFVDYLTKKEKNIEFVTKAGYIPGTDEAFEGLFEDLSVVENPKYRMLYEAVSDMYGDYSFVALPVFEGASQLQKSFDDDITDVFSRARVSYMARVSAGEDSDAVMAELVESTLEQIRNEYK